MAVEQALPTTNSQDRQTDRNLIHYDQIEVPAVEHNKHGRQEHSDEGAQGNAFMEKVARKQVAPHLHLESPIDRFLEAVLLVVVGCINLDGVALTLQCDGHVHNELFCSADPQVGVNEADPVFLLLLH